MEGNEERFGDPSFEQFVRETAYGLWERDGRPDGREQHYWYQALAKCMRRREEEERLKRGLIDPI
jgi:hypothetical protein